MQLYPNELGPKNSLGQMVEVTGDGTQVARRLWIHHNHFHDFTAPGGNGAETIRLGLSGSSLSTGDAIVFIRSIYRGK
jgi:poly(beta-D-mannuronate) lyase